MEKSSSRTIEVTVIRAEGLLMNRRQPVKKNAFVVVRSDPFNSRSTGTNQDGGSYPAWNEKLVMDLPGHAKFITVEAHAGSKLIGTANIPVADFAGGFLPENHLSFLSYRLRDPINGDKNGIVDLSVKVNAAAGRGGSDGGGSCGASCSGRPLTGVPVAEGKASDHGIVTGIPVSYKY